MRIDRDLWAGRRVLVTGHTGFKGAWLSLWLQRLGAQVSGIAPGAADAADAGGAADAADAAHAGDTVDAVDAGDLPRPPSEPSLYEVARVGEGMAAEHALDVRDREGLRAALLATRPEVVIHLAAQPLVRRSLIDPAGTYETNVIGTLNLLEAVRLAGESVRAVVVVTSDKCYENMGHTASADAPGGSHPGGRGGFKEGDPLGGEDPYSSSKACAELLSAAYRRSFFADPEGPMLATARAGNVIGGGDWGQDRLLPDAVRVATGMQPAPLLVRNPDAVRPWQHVLNPLSGYLILAQRLMRDPQACGAWNFGPPATDLRPVAWLVERLGELWESAPAWEPDRGANPREAAWLALDSTKARQRLGWRPCWDLDRALRELVAWHTAHLASEDMRAVSLGQIEDFMQEAKSAELERAAP